jgi:hypothetical protein
VLDALRPPVHAPDRPPDLPPGVDLHVGSVDDPAAMRAALAGVDAVQHLAEGDLQQIASNQLEPWVSRHLVQVAMLATRVVERGEGVKPPHITTSGEQSFAQVTSDESGSTGDENA